MIGISSSKCTDKTAIKPITTPVTAPKFDPTCMGYFIATWGIGYTPQPFTTGPVFDGQFDTDDEITLRLDLAKSQLSLFINGKGKGMVFDNIQKRRGMKYRLAVCIHSKKGEITIM